MISPPASPTPPLVTVIRRLGLGSTIPVALLWDAHEGDDEAEALAGFC
jgi:hypothetical protein